MTVIGDELIHNCRECFVQNGYGIKLEEKGGVFVCKHNPQHQYVIKAGFLQKSTGNYRF